VSPHRLDPRAVARALRDALTLDPLTLAANRVADAVVDRQAARPTGSGPRASHDAPAPDATP